MTRVVPQKFLPLFILLLAFGLQTAYLAELRELFPQSFMDKPFCGVDAEAHVQRAVGLLDGSVPGDNEVFYFIPLYPIYLAALRQFWETALLLPVLGQALLQLLGIAALYSIGRLTYSPLTGALAALGLATYNYYIFYLPCFDQALLTTPFLLLGIFLLLKYHARRHSLYVLGAGIAFGLAGLSRPTVLLVLPVAVIWIFWMRASVKQVAIDFLFFVLPLLMLIAPFTWHNYQASGRLMLLSDNFGINLFTGNNPNAQGFDSLAHIQSQPSVLRFLETIEQVKQGKTTYPAEVLQYVREQPLDALALTATKTWLWFGEAEPRLIEPFFPLTIRQTRILAPLPLAWQAMALMALLGILLVRGRCWPRTALLLAIYATVSLATILFFIQFRFRLPVIPLVMLFAAAPVASASRWSRQRPQRFWLALGLLLLLTPLTPGLGLFVIFFAGLGFWPYLRQKHWTGYHWGAAVIGLYLLLVGLWTRANALATDISQTMDIYLGPPLAGSSILGQTFRMDCDNFNQLEITLGTFDHHHDQPVTFYLAADTSTQEILYTETFAGNTVGDYQKRTFSFPSITNSAGCTFFFFLSSPTATPDKAITARGYSSSPIDYYPNGSAFVGELENLQQFQADFAFKATCDLSLAEKIQAVFTKF
ncbi:MAG: glycosyltransferase family 39 protein [Anaerolineae bacterium]|nr:glycosyltransferase family 39 protein [Anaerolineae bacterium]